MKICLKENEFNPSFIALYGEERAKEQGYIIVEIDEQYSDCCFEDFDNLVFSIKKYNTRKNKENDDLTIIKLIENLKSTDYIANKLIEAETEEERQQLRLKYATQLANRKQWRKEISDLQDKIKTLEQGE